MRLAERKCVPCHGGVPPLEKREAERLLGELGNEWRITDGHHLEKTFPFPDFLEALAFANRAGDVAEREGHHPELQIGWGKAKVLIWTHAIDGLTESDFVLAAKIDEVR